jgi:hypothetical protein
MKCIHKYYNVMYNIRSLQSILNFYQSQVRYLDRFKMFALEYYKQHSTSKNHYIYIYEEKTFLSPN